MGSDITDLKARAVIVDMEEGVINQMLKSELGELFDERQFISDVSGAGNNWAHGFYDYGKKYETMLVEKIGRAVEQCDSLQSFVLMHSLGGGTGSGVGTFILGRSSSLIQFLRITIQMCSALRHLFSPRRTMMLSPRHTTQCSPSMN